MTEFDTEAFAKAFATGLAEAMGSGESQEAQAPSVADLAQAVRENPELDVEKIVERWESLQPDPPQAKGGSTSGDSQADKADTRADTKADAKAKTTVEALFAEAAKNGSTTKPKGEDKVDIMGNEAARLKSLEEALFTS